MFKSRNERCLQSLCSTALSLWFCLQVSAAPSSGFDVISLAELSPDSAEQGYGALRVDRSVMGKPLRIGDRQFAKGLGTHAPSEIVYSLHDEGQEFEAWVGVDAALGPTNRGTVVFQVVGDDKKLFDSGVMRADTPAKRVSVSLTGVRTLKLVVTDAGDSKDSDHADWAEPVLFLKRQPSVTSRKVAHQVKGGGLTVRLSSTGEVLGLRAKGFEHAVSGSAGISGFRTEGHVLSAKEKNGAMSFTRTVAEISGKKCTIVERFTPKPDSVCWAIEISSPGEPWSAPVFTKVEFLEPEPLQFWTAWADPERLGDIWRDPLEPRAFFDAYWHYGNVAHVAPKSGDFISLPVATALDARGDGAVSMVLSPEDVLLNIDLSTSASGRVRWSRTNYRIGGGKTLKLEMNLVAHEASSRGALRYMTQKYAALFEPPNPRVHSMAGCGAYSGNERPIDAEKFKKMSFKINWKLSDDFAYMGMFIPPVKSIQERWVRSCDEPAPPGKTETTSCEQQNAYGRWMRQNGFHVLNYFNVTEFGKNMKDREVSASEAANPELWKDPVAFAKLTFPGAIYEPKLPRMYYGAWLVDIGDPEFCKFMLEQARRHIELLPDTDGICIDRMDWLRYYNRNADDGVSFVQGKPARSMFLSWIHFMEQLGPIMHKADKVIFGNTMTMRLELNRQLDGIYTEQGNNPGALNGAALMGLRKPVLSWTYKETLTQPDPDTFFQRQLYLGVYPTAPYAGNHHCINPDPTWERWYIDYGRLMDAIRGRKWVLTPHAVTTTTSGVKLNLFRVPGGYALPVVFGKGSHATVYLDGLPDLKAAHIEVLHPGADSAMPLKAARHKDRTELHVPLERGCGMVLIKTQISKAKP
jgi:hypothetical protein